VHERGVGETRSCGTGACAAAYAALAAEGRTAGTVVVDVPGGRLTVRVDGTTTVLTGPAVLVAGGELTGEWLTR
jgi:diaminopimelate epimerase